MFSKEGCQWMGPEVDPLRDWPVKKCGCTVINGTSWCADHYWKVYKKGSSVSGKTRAKEIDEEIKELKRLQEMDND